MANGICDVSGRPPTVGAKARVSGRYRNVELCREHFEAPAGRCDAGPRRVVEWRFGGASLRGSMLDEMMGGRPLRGAFGGDSPADGMLRGAYPFDPPYDPIDEVREDSFPASDQPAFTGITLGPPGRGPASQEARA